MTDKCKVPFLICYIVPVTRQFGMFFLLFGSKPVLSFALCRHCLPLQLLELWPALAPVRLLHRGYAIDEILFLSNGENLLQIRCFRSNCGCWCCFCNQTEETEEPGRLDILGLLLCRVMRVTTAFSHCKAFLKAELELEQKLRNVRGCTCSGLSDPQF